MTGKKRRRSSPSNTTGTGASAEIGGGGGTRNNHGKRRRMSGGTTSAVAPPSSFLSKLETLRRFVNSDGRFSEEDMSRCLRRCNYNVEMAASELLLLGGDDDGGNDGGGGGPSSGGGASVRASASTSTSTSTSTKSSSSSASGRAGAMAISVDDDDDVIEVMDDRSNGASSSDGPRGRRARRSSTSVSSKGTNRTEEASVGDGDDDPRRRLLLCVRWIVGSSTTLRNGRVHHGEHLDLTASQSGPPMVRFKGRRGRIEGTLPRDLALCLTPLLRFRCEEEEENEGQRPLVSIRGEALMDDVGVRLGAEVPLSISVFIEHPSRFFDLFDDGRVSSASPKANGSWFGGKRAGGRNKSGSLLAPPLTEAAFQLLQWAQYGDEMPSFAEAPSPGGSATASDEGGVGRPSGGATTGSFPPSSTSLTATTSTVGPADVEADDGADVGEAEGSNDDTDGDYDDDDDDATVFKEDAFVPESETCADGGGDVVPSWAKSFLDEDDGADEDTGCTKVGGGAADADGPGGGADDDPATLLPEACDPAGFRDGVTLRSYQRQALHWMMRREEDEESSDDRRADVTRELALLAELVAAQRGSSPMASSSSASFLDGNDGSGSPGIRCECGPVVVTEDEADRSATLNGDVNPVHHPLWQRRFLATASMDGAVSFYVNELLGTASASPPNPPKGCVGGVLSDAMGLGKTIQALALIMKTKEQALGAGGDGADVAKGTTLVITPLSLLSQWEDEISTKTRLSYHVHYGDSRVDSSEIDTFENVDIVLTTYGTIQGEYIGSRRRSGRCTSMNSERDACLGTSSKSALLCMSWLRVILDEAHCIKNPQTAVSKACCLLESERRWALTGTPIQNSLQDVYGLLKYLKHEPWCEQGFWKKTITDAASYDGNDSEKRSDDIHGAGRRGQEERNSACVDGDGMKVALARVKRVLAPLMLRRTKHSLNRDGTPILSLPPVESRVITVDFSPAEREFYNALLDRSQSVFEGFIKSGTATKSWFAIFSLLHRLRQSCDHVALTVKSRIDGDEAVTWANPSQEKENMLREAAPNTDHGTSADSAISDKFLHSLLKSFHKQQRCNRQAAKNQTSSSSDQQHASSNAEILPFATQVAESLSQAIESKSSNMDEECPICLDRPPVDDSVLTPCAHLFCRDCLFSVLNDRASKEDRSQHKMRQGRVSGACPVCNEWVDAANIVAVSRSQGGDEVASSYCLAESTPLYNKSCRKSSIDETKDGDIARAALEKGLSGENSAKLNAIMEELEAVWIQDPCSKVLIFSQFLGFLDIIESALEERRITFGRLDGKMSLKERTAALEKFSKRNIKLCRTHEGDAKQRRGSVFLISMRAGGVGLNLVSASSVFIVDPWWNSATEDQCINRIHRIGQTAKVVRVRKFIVVDSVEEKILSLQKRKKEMAGEVLEDGGVGKFSDSKPTLDDFKILFGR